MIFKELPLRGAYEIELERKEDGRGFFARMSCQDEFLTLGITINWQQVNCSFTKSKGTVRGLHYQRQPFSDAKLVRCIRGAAWDVIVDLREGSLTYGEWTRVILDEEKRSMVYIPPGFAHGFQSLQANTELLYFHSNAYAPDFEGGLPYNDPTLKIGWKLPVHGLSARDSNFLPFNSWDHGL